MIASARRRWVPVLSVVGVGVLLGSGLGIAGGSAAGVAADTRATSPADLPEPSKDQLENSVQRWEVNGVKEWNTSESVEPLVTNKKDGDDAVITLASDILFDFSSAEISDKAEKAIATTVEKVPDGTKVTVSDTPIRSATMRRTRSCRRRGRRRWPMSSPTHGPTST